MFIWVGGGGNRALQLSSSFHSIPTLFHEVPWAETELQGHLRAKDQLSSQAAKAHILLQDPKLGMLGGRERL
jgi:hypothetical protein